ncbi:MAG TPA: hypothetical protein VH309_08320, partial [Elusimicrobiota bacterium]|nr:hypothetical protein [Elusimicrobiota bacterium]
DWVQATIDASVPETKARMIRLEARQAVAEAAPAAGGAPAPLQVLPAMFLVADGRALALCSNAELASELEKDAELASLLRQKGQFERGGWRFVFRDAAVYGDRTLYDYVAVK